MTPNLDALFSSFFVVWIAITCVAGAFFLITIPDVRWFLENMLDWFVLRLLPRVDAWGMRHHRFLKIIDRAVIGTGMLIVMLRALVFHDWVTIVFRGFFLWKLYQRINKERVSDREQRYLERLESELHE